MSTLRKKTQMNVIYFIMFWSKLQYQQTQRKFVANLLGSKRNCFETLAG